MARLLEVSISGYFAHKKRSSATGLTVRQQRRVDMDTKILVHHRQSHGVYGSPRITADLRATGESVTEKFVAARMSSLGIVGISPRTFKVRTTVVDPDASFPPDLVQRRFDRGRIDAVWTTDITYLSCGDGDMYLCAIKDEHSKKVLGWAVADHMRTEMVIAALDMAVASRGGVCTGVILHSDRGTQFTATAFAEACDRYGLLRSMGATGICWDNAGAESLWSTFKHEYYYRHAFGSSSELIGGVDNWIVRYNTVRRHSVIGMLSPTVYEQSLHAADLAA